jgi:hypothetical protein
MIFLYKLRFAGAFRGMIQTGSQPFAVVDRALQSILYVRYRDSRRIQQPLIDVCKRKEVTMSRTTSSMVSQFPTGARLNSFFHLRVKEIEPAKGNVCRREE